MPRAGRIAIRPVLSHARDEAVDDALAAGLVEIDRELVAVDLGDQAVAGLLGTCARPVSTGPPNLAALAEPIDLLA
jgi:hypothetical protein